MKLTYIEVLVKQYRDMMGQVVEIKEELSQFVKNPENPHELRWQVFCGCGLGLHHPYSQTPPGKWDKTLSDYDRFPRHSTVDLTNLDREYGYEWATPEDWVELEEWAMKNNTRSWEVDW
jgi:hypothetical protein